MLEIDQEKLQQILHELEENAQYNPDTRELLKKIKNITEEEVSLEPNLKEIVYELSTLRNRNLMSKEQQRKLSDTVVCFFGLSVGSQAALTWVMESRPDTVKIVDPDTIDATNLNRLRFGWNSLGKYKADVVRDTMLEIHPFIKVSSEKGTDYESTVKILDEKPVVNVIVDEVDDLESKVRLRKLARERKISVISATDVGDNVILDIERYDLPTQPEIFLGRVKSTDLENVDILQLSRQERMRITMEIVGYENCSEEMIDSLLSIGKSLKTWPQLGATATIAGGAVTTAIKKIILGEQVKSGRYALSLDHILVGEMGKFATREHKIEKLKSLL